MTPREKAISNAERSVKEFFHECIPEKVRPKFWEAAKRYRPQMIDELQQIKKQMQDDTTPMEVLALACQTFEAKSKSMIRQVAIEMMSFRPPKS